MFDLEEEHEMNKYLLQQEKELRDKMDGMIKKQERYASQPVFSVKKPAFKEDYQVRGSAYSGNQPTSKLQNMEQISRKEEELLEQLSQLRDMKKQYKN